MKTIVGIATPVGIGGVAIIRLSGQDAINIAKKICNTYGQNKLDFNNGASKLQLCKIKTNIFEDIGYVVYFMAPNSFTGENVVEFHAHGGALIPQKVVDECIRLGAVQSIAGEFSKRAFINGKMTLDKAEGIIDSINAESEAELAASEKLAGGELAKKIDECQGKLRVVLAGINTLLDFPSEDGSEEDQILGEAKEAFKEVTTNLGNILKTYRTGRMIKTGVIAVLCGRPNAGKSSVLNALAASDSAIVSNIPGTTRDIVKETILFNGIKFNLCDTAGLRVTTDEIEKIGVLKAKNAMQGADLVVYIIDGSVPITNEDIQNLKELKSNNLIVVINKTDLITKSHFEELAAFDTIEISTINHKNIDELKQKMFDRCKVEKFDSGAIILTNARHAGAISSALIALGEAEEGLEVLSLDVISSIIQSGYNHLGEVTGECGSDAVASEIFSNFCVGK